MAHTPGPWIVFNGIDIYPQSDDRGARHHIADCNPDSGDWSITDITFDEALANARLIAAAPDLLETLKRISYGLTAPEDDVQRAIRMAADAAIAKAEGQ